jgi:hypothetical protein
MRLGVLSEPLGLALRPQSTASPLQLRDGRHQTKAQSVARPRPTALAAAEAVGEAWQVSCGHAGTVVLHHQARFSSLVGEQTYASLRSGWRMTQRVLHQVSDRLRQQFLVPVSDDAGCHVRGKAMPSFLRVRPKSVRDGLRHGANVYLPSLNEPARSLASPLPAGDRQQFDVRGVGGLMR